MSKLAPAHGTAPACPGAALGGSWYWCGSPSGCGASVASSHGGAKRTASGSGSGLDPVQEVTLSLEVWGGWLPRSPALSGCRWELAGALVLPWSTQSPGLVLPQALVLAPAPEGAPLESCRECSLCSQSRARGDPSAVPLPWGLGGV